MLPRYTPYSDPEPSFAIGLKPLDLNNWIEVDEHLPRYLSEKRRLIASIPGKVWAGDFSSEVAQREVLDILVPHLLAQFPDLYNRDGNVVSVKDSECVDLDDVSMPPLQLAALLVQEDLVLMRKSAEGWRLVAASLCFPSSWILREKIGKVMHEVHSPVPGFEKGTRNATMIERIFDNLQADLPAERFNWSIYNDDKLYHEDRAGEHFPDHSKGENEHFLRVERQTLRKLPKSGDILFGIRIHIDPIEALAARPDRQALGREFIRNIEAIPRDQAIYKGLEDHRQQLIDRITEVTERS